MLKITGIIILSVLLIFIGAKVISFMQQKHQLDAQLSDLEQRLTKAEEQQSNLQADEQYLANPLNLEKELRSRFNYKKPGETMVVIVPPQATSTATTTVIH